MPKRAELAVEQRREAVLALLRRAEPAVQLAGRYGSCSCWAAAFRQSPGPRQPPSARPNR